MCDAVISVTLLYVTSERLCVSNLNDNERLGYNRSSHPQFSTVLRRDLEGRQAFHCHFVVKPPGLKGEAIRSQRFSSGASDLSQKDCTSQVTASDTELLFLRFFS